jgi:spermidine/putrescine-binding protein
MSKLPNVSKYVDPRLSGIQFDPDEAISNQVYSYAAPYMYCTVGLIYNRDELGMLTDNDPAQVWQTLFDTKRENRIGMYNSMRESIGSALNYLGYSLNTVAAAELEEAKQLLIEQRKTVKPIVGIDDLKDKYVSGELAAGIAWSGDHVVCNKSSRMAGRIRKCFNIFFLRVQICQLI